VPNEGPVGQGVATEKRQYSADLITAEALAFIDRQRDRPFFLYYAPTLPHANNEANRATGLGNEVPDLGEYRDRDWSEGNKAYAAMVARLDADVGRLLDLLEHRGLADNTLVIFSSDNGPHREGGSDPEFFDSNGPLRGIKRDLYEGGIRVPMIARWPGRIRAGSVSDHIGYFGDLMATVAAIAGATSPGGIESVSFLPTLLGQPEKQERHSHLYWEFYERGSSQAVRKDRWKAVRKPMLTGTIELYDLQADLGEQRDLAAQHPERVAEMRALMEKAHVPSPLWQIRPR
jgi:arylsulfatase A-like enzyme